MASTLYLIRHGQASFMKANYDELSALGWQQARKLGAWAKDQGVQYDRCLHGTLARQRDTLLRRPER
ncbi:MAG: phosphoglycerate mutase family protein, partial [Bacteroidota bacterium]